MARGLSLGRNQSPLVALFGALVAGIAIVGTQFLGWEWGSGQLLPTIIGVGVALVAVVFVVGQKLGWLE